jgi:hypothetical protein
MEFLLVGSIGILKIVRLQAGQFQLYGQFMLTSQCVDISDRLNFLPKF